TQRCGWSVSGRQATELALVRGDPRMTALARRLAYPISAAYFSLLAEVKFLKPLIEIVRGLPTPPVRAQSVLDFAISFLADIHSGPSPIPPIRGVGIWGRAPREARLVFIKTRMWIFVSAPAAAHAANAGIRRPNRERRTPLAARKAFGRQAAASAFRF